MLCPKCNKEVENDSAFCVYCGEKFDTAPMDGAPENAEFESPTDFGAAEPVYENTFEGGGADLGGGYVGEPAEVKKSKKWIWITIGAVALIAVIVVAGFFTNWFGLCEDEETYISDTLYLSGDELWYYNIDQDKAIMVIEDVDGNASEYSNYIRISDDGNTIYYLDEIGTNGGTLCKKVLSKPDDPATEIQKKVTDYRFFGDSGWILYVKSGKVYEYDTSKEADAIKVKDECWENTSYLNESQYIYAESEDDEYSLYIKSFGKDDAEKVTKKAAEYSVIDGELYWTEKGKTKEFDCEDYVEFDEEKGGDEEEDDYYDYSPADDVKGQKVEIQLWDLFKYNNGNPETVIENGAVYLSSNYCAYSTVNFDFEDKIKAEDVYGTDSVKSFIEDKAAQVTTVIVEDETYTLDLTTLPEGAKMIDTNEDVSKVIYKMDEDKKEGTFTLYEASVKSGTIKEGKEIVKDAYGAGYSNNKVVYYLNEETDEDTYVATKDVYYDGELIAKGISGFGSYDNGDYYYYTYDKEGKYDEYKINIDGTDYDVDAEGIVGEITKMDDGRYVYYVSDTNKKGDTEYELFVFDKDGFVSVADGLKDVRCGNDYTIKEGYKYMDLLYLDGDTLFVLDGAQGRELAKDVDEIIWPYSRY